MIFADEPFLHATAQTRNSLMYPPDANITTTNRRTSSLPTASSSQTAADKTRGIVEPPAILHANTRVWEGQDAGADAPDSPRSSRIEAAIKGWGCKWCVLIPSIACHLDSSVLLSHRCPITDGSDASSDAGLSLFGAGLNAEPSTPRVAGFGFVSAMPSPTPRQLGEDRVRQLMTWGTVEGTPRAVREGGGDESECGSGGWSERAHNFRGFCMLMEGIYFVFASCDALQLRCTVSRPTTPLQSLLQINSLTNIATHIFPPSPPRCRHAVRDSPQSSSRTTSAQAIVLRIPFFAVFVPIFSLARQSTRLAHELWLRYCAVYAGSRCWSITIWRSAQG